MNDGKRIEASTRTLEIIEALGDLELASASEIAETVGLADSTAHYHLKTLESAGFIKSENGKYRLSMKLLNVGHKAVNHLDLYQVGKSKVDQLAEETKELCILMIEEHGYGYYIYENKGENAVDWDTTGSQKYLHDNSLGKAVLAHLPEERVERIIDERGLPPATENTITDREALYDELAEIRERGVSYDLEEQLMGLRCVAAPIRYPSDHRTPDIRGGISITGPANRLRGDYLREELATAVSDAANIVELEMKEY